MLTGHFMEIEDRAARCQTPGHMERWVVCECGYQANCGHTPGHDITQTMLCHRVAEIEKRLNGEVPDA